MDDLRCKEEIGNKELTILMDFDVCFTCSAYCFSFKSVSVYSFSFWKLNNNRQSHLIFYLEFGIPNYGIYLDKQNKASD